MPQMAPIFWSVLFTFFCLFLIFSAIKLYFSKESYPTAVSTSKILSSNKKNWLW